MTSRLTPASDQLSSNLPTHQLPRAPNIRPGASARTLHEAASAARHATSTLLKDTKWPVESNDAAENLFQTISNLPDLPADNIPFKDTAEQFVQALEATLVSVRNASEKYGERKRGFRDRLKYDFSSLRPGKCSKILQTCKEDVEKISVVLRNYVDGAQAPGSTSGSPGNTEMPSGLQAHSTVPSGQVEGHLGSSVSPPAANTKAEEQLPGSGHAAGHPASIPQTSSEVPADQEDRRPIRDGVIIAAKKTFETVETISGAIPGVGDFVGVAAKVGLAFVGMIETMDQNEDVSKELASHTSNLSTYLEYFKKKSEVDKGDGFVTQIDNIHKELELVKKKVGLWNSSGRLKKAFLASEHADELKGYQDTVQNALEEMQLLVGLKTADVVIELKNAELREERRRLLNCLGDGSYGARGNSIQDVICLPGTRVGILDRINRWIKDTSSSTERVLWIRGMAGRGKSAIASTVAHNWASKGSCAIYHFRRGQNALDGQFVCALARQLGKGLVPEVKEAILDSVRENEDIAKERLDQQFKTLIVGSLGTLQDHAHPIVIIIDALDECENVRDAVQFVKLIDHHSSSIPNNVKFLLTCRPEAPLLVALEPRKWHAEDLDSIPDLSDDITRFLQHGCRQIRDDHGLPETWPSQVELKGIVEMSQGLFQWARTAIAYMDNKSPADRLRDLLQWSSTWSGLDELYHQILSKAFKEVEIDSMRREMLSWVLGTLVVAPYPVSLDIIMFLYNDHKLFADRDVVQFLRRDILADLNSLLHIPTSSSEPIRLMHTSIRDLLTDQERCKDKPHFVDLAQNHRRLATLCLSIMERDLELNICRLSDVFKSNLEVQIEIDTHVSKGLRYCCQSWSTHLTTGVTWSETAETRSRVLEKFQLISDEKLLSWLEVMSLTGAMMDAFKMAKQVYQWFMCCPEEMSNNSLISMWGDIQRFITAFWEPISFCALHIYASALTQCPVETTLWARYGNQAATRILVGKRRGNWSKNIWVSSADAFVNSVAFSPNGDLVASALGSGTVALLDAQTGAPQGEPLTGHSDSIRSVVFSPDGKTLATGSDDGTIRLWDAQTGAPQGQPLTGLSWITPVVFSPDGKTLATGSHDGTIRLWDAQTGASTGPPLTDDSGILAFQGLCRTLPWASKPRPLNGLSSNDIPAHITIHSNWLVCGSRRLIWLTPGSLDSYSSVEVLSPRALGVWSGKGYTIFDVSRCFEF